MCTTSWEKPSVMKAQIFKGSQVKIKPFKLGFFTRSHCSYRFMRTSRVADFTEGLLDAGGLSHNKDTHKICKCCFMLKRTGKTVFKPFHLSPENLFFRVEHARGL